LLKNILRKQIIVGYFSGLHELQLKEFLAWPAMPLIFRVRPKVMQDFRPGQKIHERFGSDPSLYLAEHYAMYQLLIEIRLFPGVNEVYVDPDPYFSDRQR
jgi:hypothetical protein